MRSSAASSTRSARSVNDAPAMTPELSTALAKLLAQRRERSALPLAAKWDKAGVLKARGREADDRARRANADANSAARRTSASPRRTACSAFARAERRSPARRAGSSATSGSLAVSSASSSARSARPATPPSGPRWPRTSASSRPTRRPPPSTRCSSARMGERLPRRGEGEADRCRPTLGPANAARLRTHPDKAVAKRANAMLDELNPTARR